MNSAMIFPIAIKFTTTIILCFLLSTSYAWIASAYIGFIAAVVIYSLISEGISKLITDHVTALSTAAKSYYDRHGNLDIFKNFGIVYIIASVLDICIILACIMGSSYIVAACAVISASYYYTFRQITYNFSIVLKEKNYI